MHFTDLQFVHVTPSGEEIIKGREPGPKWAYYALVREACNLSAAVLRNFLTNEAEKFRIYTAADVAGFTMAKRNSTRIKDDSCRITVSGADYYVANNLKICEYFNSAAMNIESSDLGNWFIRIYFDDSEVKPMEDIDEAEEVEADREEYSLTLVPAPAAGSHTAGSHTGASRAVKVDFDALHKAKKKIGDLGEELIMIYEKDRLTAAGRSDLAARIEHTARVRGDGTGYDIHSFKDDGSDLYIEVKTTRQNTAASFYLSRNEKAFSDKHVAEYRIYRIYGLNSRTGKGWLTIYEPPFDSSRYTMEPANWKVGLSDPVNGIRL